jgi:hypothetical protein
MAKKKKAASNPTTLRFADKKPEVLAVQRPAQKPETTPVEVTEATDDPVSSSPQQEKPNIDVASEGNEPQSESEEVAITDREQSSENQAEEQPADDYKPKKKPKYQPLPQLESATNVKGEVFKPGDRISVSAPWGGRSLAEIELFYQADSGEVWAQYKPVESIPEKWTWLGGVIRAELLLISNPTS